MKHILLIYSLFAGFSLLGQSAIDKDSLNVFGYQEEKTRMLKLDVLQLFYRQQAKGIGGLVLLSYEYKMKPAWSLNAVLATPWWISSDRSIRQLPLGSGELGLAAGLRYYPGLAKAYHRGNCANHLSADYYSLLIGSRLTQSEGGLTVTDDGPFFYTDNISFSLIYGIQRRVLDYWYIDFSLGLQLSYGDPLRVQQFFAYTNGSGWQIYPIANFQLGIAF